MKKTIVILCLICNYICGQDGSINCDSLLFPEYRGYFTVETMAEPVGGYARLQSRLVYPEKAIENKIEGKVYIRVVIDSVSNQLCVRVIKSLGYGCDEEALRLVQSSEFIPGTLRGKPFTMPVSISIIFSLEEKGKE